MTDDDRRRLDYYIRVCESALRDLGVDLASGERLDCLVLKFSPDDRDRRLLAWAIESLHHGLSALKRADVNMAFRCHGQVKEYRAQTRHVWGWNATLSDGAGVLQGDVDDFIRRAMDARREGKWQ